MAGAVPRFMLAAGGAFPGAAAGLVASTWTTGSTGAANTLALRAPLGLPCAPRAAMAALCDVLVAR